MKEIASLSFRLDRRLISFLRKRAARNNRSMNGEFSAILRELAETEKASGPAVGSSPDASLNNE